MNIIITLSGLFALLLNLKGQEIITFPSKDSLIITATLYEEDPSYPYIVLFHQAGFSRGEYKETAPKFTNLGYNCLAVDLRSGEHVNSVYNETAKRAKDKKLPTEYLDAKQDIEAAIDFAYKKSKKPVVVVGSSYSASLSLIVAKNNPKVKAVVAFSPGEYFGKALNVQNSLKNFDKPVFAACSQREYSYVVTLLSNVPENLKTIFKPAEHQGEHGSKCLWASNPSSKEYWLAILMFFNKIKQ
ncbi:MAG: dienelactone hydrolase family protein [Bacteroidales bacterium]|nr:dienelactone hydrolase family protein [Bacteroidales bacterium]